MADAYQELYKRIVDAHNKMLENRVRANTVIINGRKYGMLGKTIEDALLHGYTPTIVGLSTDVTCGLPDDFDFVVMEKNNPPRSEFDKLRDENRELRDENTCLKNRIKQIEYILRGGCDDSD